MTSLQSGLVLKSQSGFYQVLCGQDVIECRLRGKLKRGPQVVDLVAIGDRVLIEMQDERKGTIEKIVPRKVVFSRMDPRPQGLYEQVLLANPDQLMIVFACAQPEPHRRMLDRFLVIAEQKEIKPIIIANKCDLVTRDYAEELFGLYRPLGYQVILSSTKTGEGIEEIHECLKDKITALTGPSGVGKSSLVSCIEPGLNPRFAKISHATGKGRHTTEVRELYPLSAGGFLADMPGIRALALWDIQPEELDGYFPDLRQLIGKCQYADCSHQAEPGCEVKRAVENGNVHPERYKSYIYMRFGVTDL